MMVGRRKRSKSAGKNKELLTAQSQLHYAQTGSTLARILFVAVVAFIALIPLWYLHSFYGPLAVVISVGGLALIALVAGLILVGIEMSNRSQENFIDALSELKSVMAPAMREEARTVGVVDRANAEIAKREVLSQMQIEQRQAPQIEQRKMIEDWIGQSDNDTNFVESEMYEIR